MLLHLAVSEGKAESRERDGTYFMDFEALRREPDTSVKIYLSTHEQVRGSVVRDEIVQRSLCTYSNSEKADWKLRRTSFFGR